MPKLRLMSPVHCAAVTCAFALIVAITWTTARPTVSQNHRAVQSAVPQIPASLENQVSTTDRAQIAETYGKLPLSFEANQGQSDKQVKFLSRGQGYTLFLTGDEASAAVPLPMPIVTGWQLCSLPHSKRKNRIPPCCA